MCVVHLLALVFAGLVFSLMSGRFKCGALSCGRSFDSSSALLRHRLSCLYYKQESATAQASIHCKRPLLRANVMTNSVAKKAKVDQPEISVNVGELTILDVLCVSL